MFIVWLFLANPRAAISDIPNVTAFARLFGVVRFFYPSDRAAALDWNQFAVEGVSKTLGIADPDALRSTLRQLFSPLGPGIVIDTELPTPTVSNDSPQPLVAWRYSGPGF